MVNSCVGVLTWTSWWPPVSDIGTTAMPPALETGHALPQAQEVEYRTSSPSKVGFVAVEGPARWRG
jgi:hypothetical protein